jgi:hypothetical protein
VYTVGFILLSFVVYQSLTETKFLSWLLGKEISHNTQVLLSRFSGFIILGLTGLFIESQNDFQGIKNLVTPEFLAAKYWILLGLILILVINILTTAPDGRDKYPQLKYDVWHTGNIILNSITWLVYLFSYEWLLRGPLLAELVSLSGIWIGVGINVIVYSLVHAVKGRKEMIASIPVGIILCLLSLYTNSFLIAFVFHGAFALAYEYVLVYQQAHPRFKSIGQ